MTTINDMIKNLEKMKNMYGGEMRVFSLQYKDNGKRIGYFDAHIANKKSMFHVSEENKHVSCIVV